MIGFVARIGIEIMNSILLVDFTNQLLLTNVGIRAAAAMPVSSPVPATV